MQNLVKCLDHRGMVNPQLPRGALSNVQQKQAGKGGLDYECKQKALMGSHSRFATLSLCHVQKLGCQVFLSRDTVLLRLADVL